MISLAGRDIANSWSKFALTGLGLGLLIGVTLTMAGVYRGMVDDAMALLNNSGADLWVVQKDTQGPYAESSSIRDDYVRGVLGMPGVARAANITYLTMQVRKGEGEIRAMVVGIEAQQIGEPTYLLAGRQITQSHYEALADIKTGFQINDLIQIKRHQYRVVGITRRMVSSGGDPMVFIPIKDAQEAQFLKDNDAILNDRARNVANPSLNRPIPGLLDAITAAQSTNHNVNSILAASGRMRMWSDSKIRSTEFSTTVSSSSPVKTGRPSATLRAFSSSIKLIRCHAWMPGTAVYSTRCAGNSVPIRVNCRPCGSTANGCGPISSNFMTMSGWPVTGGLSMPEAPAFAGRFPLIPAPPPKPSPADRSTGPGKSGTPFQVPGQTGIF